MRIKESRAVGKDDLRFINVLCIDTNDRSYVLIHPNP